MRKSHEGINGVSKDTYKELPDELQEFSYYYDDGETGHVIMAIPECLLDEAVQNGDLDLFECPFPTKYVLANGYRILDNHVVCDGTYEIPFGLSIDETWYEV